MKMVVKEDHGSLPDGMNILVQEGEEVDDMDVEIVKDEIQPDSVIKTFKCSSCGYTFKNDIAEFKTCIVCPNCKKQTLSVVYKGIPVVESISDNARFDWDEDFIFMIEDETNLQEGIDYIRAKNGAIVCRTEKARGVFT